MAAFIPKLATWIFLSIVLLPIFLYITPFITSLLFVFILLYIIAFEYPKLFNMKNIWFWIIIPLYPILPFSLIIYMCSYYKYRILMLYMIILSASHDTGAYIAGSLFGKFKLAPSISPKKTWEGFFGGYFATSMILSLILLFQGAHISLAFVLLFAFAVSVLATLGDLFESLLKRNAGIKDTGDILPGHGGFLDRVDSLLTVVFLFFFLKDYLLKIFNI